MIPPIMNSSFVHRSGLTKLIPQTPFPSRPVPILPRIDPQPIHPVVFYESDIASTVYDTVSVPDTSTVSQHVPPRLIPVQVPDQSRPSQVLTITDEEDGQQS